MQAKTLNDALIHIKKHASAMSEQCRDDKGRCAYRSIDGERSCFIGALITDENAKGLGQDSINDPNVWYAIEKSGYDIAREHLDLLSAIQDVHDMGKPNGWIESIEQLEVCYLGKVSG